MSPMNKGPPASGIRRECLLSMIYHRFIEYTFSIQSMYNVQKFSIFFSSAIYIFNINYFSHPLVHIANRMLICIAPLLYIWTYSFHCWGHMILNPFQHHLISFNYQSMKIIFTYGNKNCPEQRIFLLVLWPQCLCLVPETFSWNFGQILQFCKQTIPERKF